IIQKNSRRKRSERYAQRFTVGSMPIQQCTRAAIKMKIPVNRFNVRPRTRKVQPCKRIRQYNISKCGFGMENSAHDVTGAEKYPDAFSAS
ncbi:MAG: hypothetical protein PHX58_14935, partial [Desulfovibrio sp.]|nr:hypothetical protein [Desulfovibrio sp.]